MGNMIFKKFSFPARILDDSAVRDGLEAVSHMKDPYFLVGGIATQSYLPTNCRRPTSDVDFSVVRPLNYGSFKEMVKPVDEFLKDNGYVTETKKRSRAYSLDVFDQDGEGLCLEFIRMNKQNFERNRKMLEREFEDANIKIIEGRNSSYRVCRTEDIAVPKIVRSIGSLKRNPFFNKYIPKNIVPLTDETIKRDLERIGDLRDEVMINLADPELAEKLRFISDLYDIRVLSELSGFNEKYLQIVENDRWKTFDENPVERDKIVRAVFPSFH